MKPILITGANGQLGRARLIYLPRGRDSNLSYGYDGDRDDSRSQHYYCRSENAGCRSGKDVCNCKLVPMTNVDGCENAGYGMNNPAVSAHIRQVQLWFN